MNRSPFTEKFPFFFYYYNSMFKKADEISLLLESAGVKMGGNDSSSLRADTLVIKIEKNTH